MRTRTIEGATCAKCRNAVGLIRINGRTVEVEPTAAVLGRALVIEFHRCPEPEPRRAPRKATRS